MALSDAQIERYSRQIVLPQVGGTGQERLLRSSIAVAGDGTVAEVATLYLAGAGVGTVVLHGGNCEALRTDLIALNPEVVVMVARGELGSVSADVLVSCCAELAEIDSASASGKPLVAGGVGGDRGWLVVSDGVQPCASCAARFGVRELAPAVEWAGSGDLILPSPTPKRQQAAAPHSELPHSNAAGVIGSLVALAVLKLRLGLCERSRGWLHFLGAESALTERLLERFPDCPACSGT